ncbi:hypothetical protein O1611_g293 [Lasiodiplodia mahajangana]|uniref:Uncharacterized protein n=1 Tax=Lasiodiplodia mahajangana TaxID=1108764 RepID=A0ACC2K0L2_9PEZI|nr:hypothetical protein O1611_g293 [Lasiodiplodia mahajangana]
MLMAAVPYGLALIVGLVFILYPLASYFLDKNDLRRFPSPSIASITPFWRMWHNVLYYGHYAAVDQAHRRLGSHVRIAPNHISILDSQAPYEIYGHGANMLKEAWYDAGAGVHRNMADARNKAEHQAKRKALAHAFAAKTVTALEPVLQNTISSLMAQLDKHAAAHTKPNMRRVINYFTIDLLGQLMFGHELGCLERDDDVLVAETQCGRLYKTPFINSLLDSTVINTALAMMPDLLAITKPLAQFHPYKKAGTDWENIIYHNIKKRLANPTQQDDLFQKLLENNKGEALNLSMGELVAESSVMMNAGTETTTAAMTNTIFLLYTHPDVLRRLREELDAAFPGDTRPTYDIAARLPYLRACIEESLRVRPASSMGLPRVVPEGGRVISGQFINGGVTVSVPTYSLLRDETIFENAGMYNPDRWMTTDAAMKTRMEKNHLPFSVGPRACIGRNISYFEQIVVIAAIVKFYDGIIDDGFQLETQERFNSNPGDLPMRILRRKF